jgi:hypothetical protein
MVLPLIPPSAPSALGDLPTEIQTIILSYLVGTNASSGSKYHPGHEYADVLQFTNNHQFHPSILRISKSLYDIGKAHCKNGESGPSSTWTMPNCC